MLLNVKLSTYSIKLEELDWSAFSALWPLAQEFKPTDKWKIQDGPCRLTPEEAQSLVDLLEPLGASVSIVPLPGMMVQRLMDAGRKWGHGEEAQPQDLVTGAAVQITVPDMGLLLMDEVTWIDDACTENLQSHLDKGWRILAVCPPCAQRRPDYILGRRKTEDRR